MCSQFENRKSKFLFLSRGVKCFSDTIFKLLYHANVPQEITELHLFYDGRPGKNKNGAIIKFLILLLVNRNTKISIYFLQIDHFLTITIGML